MVPVIGAFSVHRRESKSVVVESRLTLIRQQREHAQQEVRGHAQALHLMSAYQDKVTELTGPTTYRQVNSVLAQKRSEH